VRHRLDERRFEARVAVILLLQLLFVYLASSAALCDLA